MNRKRWRQFIGLLVAVIVPSVATALLGWQVLRQQSRRDEDQRLRATAIEIVTELRDEANRIKVQEIAASESAEVYTDTSVVLDARTEDDRLVLPWESDEPNPEPYRRAQQDRQKFQDEMWRLLYGGEEGKAVDRLRSESQRPLGQAERAYLLTLRGAALRYWEGHDEEAFDVYVELLDFSSRIVNSSSRPQPAWQFAADVLIESGTRETAVLNRIKQDLDSFSALARWNVGLRSLLDRLCKSRNSTVARRAAKDLEALDRRMERLERLRDLPGIPALQDHFKDLGVTAERWAAFGEDELWLVGKGPKTDKGALVVVARASDIKQKVDEARRRRGIEQPFHFARKGEVVESLGDGLSGFPVVVDPAGASGEGATGVGGLGRQRRLFYALSLALIFGLASFGANLMWRDMLRESRLAEMRSQFVASVSHELKTPLTGIRMLAETLQTPAAAEPAIHAEYLETIVGETERLARLLNNVLDFSKIERGEKHYHMKHASLADVLRNVVRAMRLPMVEQGFEFSLEIADGVPPPADRPGRRRAGRPQSPQ
ncbi:MAG TPA: histidine kinase dimerization/phospho-acceptor domain-containing protein [Terriglobia bacterium]|nr:histidine kinase dimerization/phospho-acceptor domain-containing protein [Terriglobia bacterium]